MLRPGEIRPLLEAGRSQAHPAVAPLSALTHLQQFQQLPVPLGEPPYHVDLETVLPGIMQSATQQGSLVFHTCGDTGGVNQPQFQNTVAAAMKADLTLPDAQKPRFFYHLGDVVYFNGEVSDYYAQFYDPYDFYAPPIFAIPGNHDGDPATPSQVSLDGWVRYFMTATPHINPESKDAPRATLSLPNPYFTLNCPFVTFVGMYTNVPEGGSVDSVQQQWLTHELATAPTDKALIVALHHPIYSFDTYHSGSVRMGAVLQQAINDSRRVPNMVLAAHVHNYQRIERSLVPGSLTPFLVIGLGGYYNLHGLSVAAGATDPATEAHLISGDDSHHGYVTMTVNAQHISGVLTTAETGEPLNSNADSFSYPAAAQFLPEGVMVSL